MLSQQTQFVAILRSLIDPPKCEVAKAISLFQNHTLKRSEFFVRAGDASSKIGFVVSGILRLYYVDNDGKITGKSNTNGHPVLWIFDW